jgi:signal transduction histidine kinase
LTIPAYTPPALPDVPRAIVRPGPTLDGPPQSWRDPIDRAFSQLRATPRAVQTLLDLAGIGFTALAFAHTPLSAEFLFHGVFVVLAVHAFLFGLRGTLIRIGIASLPLLVYANAGAFGLIEEPLELSEWPLMFVIAVIVAWMADRRETTSRRYAALFRQASERLLTVQEDERRRIAGELHDGVGQVLTALTLTLDAASSEGRLETAKDHVQLARRLGDTALAETRDLAHRLRPARLEERGLVPALRDLASQSGFPVRVVANRASTDPRLLGPTATVEVYRIVQEALANAARHSGANQAVVELVGADDRLTIVVSDKGRGFTRDLLHESGIGLAGMEERAALLGGRLTTSSELGSGTRVTLTVPTIFEAGARA